MYIKFWALTIIIISNVERTWCNSLSDSSGCGGSLDSQGVKDLYAGPVREGGCAGDEHTYEHAKIVHTQHMIT